MTIKSIFQTMINNIRYFALLRDCCAAYFSARQSLLNPYIHQHVSNIQGSDLLNYSKFGSAYMLHLCTDEHKLYLEFFELGETELIRYLESLSMIVYDQFRPLILRETKIDDLAELCQSLIGYIAASENVASPIEYATSQMKRDDSVAAVQFLVRKTLQDAQQRLVFRAQQYIRAEIQGFKPRVEDIELLARGRGCIVYDF
jgi:hypothetical protein